MAFQVLQGFFGSEERRLREQTSCMRELVLGSESGE